MPHYLDPGPAYEYNPEEDQESDEELIQAALNGIFGAFHSDFFLVEDPEPFFEKLSEHLYDITFENIRDGYEKWQEWQARRPKIEAWSKSNKEY